MTPSPAEGKPRLAVSSCLLGRRVRYDGQHKRDSYLADTLGPFVEWVPICPEMEAGMGVPRESVRLVGTPETNRLIAERSGKDWTNAVEAVASSCRTAWSAEPIDGLILKKDSPSCGMEKVRVYNASGMPVRSGTGLFARRITEAFPLLPAEEDGRLNDPAIRESFVERIFAYRRWRLLGQGTLSRSTLIQFHESNKFMILAHSDPHLRRLGRLTANLKGRPIREAYAEYGSIFMEALTRRATPKQHTNVLEHMVGFLSDFLNKDEKAELLTVIHDYRRQRAPLIVPMTLMLHYVRKYPSAYLRGQCYLEPHPRELMIRNHV